MAGHDHNLEVSVLTLLMSMSFAQDQPTFRYKARTEIDFEEVHVEADLVKPDGWWIPGDPPRHHDPLIRIRADFSDRMARSVDQLE